MLLILLTSIALIPVVFAQAGQWAQCGGTGWTGATTCVSGTTCQEQNAWYYQCLPGTPSVTATTTKASSTLATSTRSASTTVTTPKATSTSTKVSSTSSKTTSSSQPSATGGWSYLISFGDSYSQTGFDITSTKATPGNILGNPTFPGWTTSGGDNWLDFLIATYNQSLILSYNFAYGGATTDASLVTPYESTVLSFIDQTTEFTSNLVPAPTYAPWTSSNALFAVWMGVNDVGNAWYASNWTDTAAAVITKYLDEVEIMYKAGARDFLFLTVPPIQYTPLQAANGATVQAQLGAAVTYFNGLLGAAASKFKAANAGSTVYVFDTTNAFMTAINSPTTYGAPNATCYNADGVSCLWYNDYHPGQAIHKLVAEGIAALVPGF